MIHVSIKPDILFYILGFPVTNTILTTWLIIGLFSIFAVWLKDNLSFENPSKVQIIAEMAVGGVLDFLAMIANSRDVAKRHFPILATVFFLILFSNWAGILPGVGSIGFKEIHDGKELLVPIFRSANSDLNITLGLAIIVVIASHAIGIRAIGAKSHIGKFVSFKNPIHFFVGILELVSEFAKIVSFSFRLFGNIFAGEVLLVIISFLVPYAAPIPFLGLEIFVGLVQATIFAVLGMMFFASAEQLPEH